MFLLMISLCGFASAMSGRILDPVVTDIAGDFGSSVASVALLATAYAIPFAVSQPVLGSLGDLFSKTFIVKAAVALLALFSAASALAPTLPLLFAARILGGAAGAGVVPIGLALIGDRVPLARRQLAINWFVAMTLFGQLLGAGVAGMIAHAFGWRSVLWFSTAIVFAVAVAAAALLTHDDTEPRQPARASAALKNYRALLSNTLSCVCFGVVFVEDICIYGSLPFIGQYLQALGKGGVRETGIVISGIAIGGLAFAFALPTLVRLLRRCHMMALGGIVGGAGLACIALGANWPIETLFMAVVGFGFFLLHNPVQTEVSELAPVPKPEIVPLKGEKSPLLAGFCNSAPVSELPDWRIHRPFREKSPATTANIPVFGRLSLETGFDLHCVRVAGVDFVGFCERESLGLGTRSTDCQARAAV